MAGYGIGGGAPDMIEQNQASVSESSAGNALGITRPPQGTPAGSRRAMQNR